MTEETWAESKIAPYLEISSTGRARRLRKPLVYKDGRQGFLPAGMLKGTIEKTGYASYSAGGKKYLAHRLVAEAFIPKSAGGVFVYSTVNHKNGIKTDNRVENLEWATHKQNNDHARNTGLCKQHGQNTNLSKFSDQLVAAMKKVRAKYGTSAADLADLFGMSKAHVYDILKGGTRKRG